MPLVRPRFLRWSAAAFAVLLPFVIHAVWDYTEALRFRARVEGIRRAGDPIGPVMPFPTGPAADTDRYYRAAAAIAGSPPARLPPRESARVRAALRSGDWAPDVLSAARGAVDANAEALALVDRGAPLPFTGFRAGWTSNYLVAGLETLAALCEDRAVVRAIDGDGDGALDSLYSEARLGRAMRWPPAFAPLADVLARAQPSARARARVAAAVAALDVPDRMHRDVALLRARVISHAMRTAASWRWYDIVERPWRTHVVNRQLDDFASGRFADASGLPQVYARATTRIACVRRLAAGEVVNCPP